ncbi:MAG: Mfa1 family fimbria major subunit [Prevotella sp.]|nr:Mfa1 family fimbria major subunit [Prevotella sp.]
MKKLILGMIACAGLCACTSEDIDFSGNEKPVFEGDKAYMTVRLCDVGTSAATTRAKDGNFETSQPGEVGVNNAYFYFFDSEGVFVSEGEVWNGNLGSPKEDNVEFTSDTQVILKGLTEKNYPKYVVTVLNKPAKFEAGETLDEFEKLLSTGTSGSIKNGDNFVMSTTSYVHQNSDDQSVKIPYFVTEVEEKDFHLEPIDKEHLGTPVNIYVERLASKVTLNVHENLKNKAKQIVDGDRTHYLYEVDETVAGDANADVQDGMAADKLYVELLGWKLNATARNSYMIKNINEKWTNSSNEDLEYNLGYAWTWNDPSNKRSYWGKSYNYGIDYEYKTNSEGNTPDNEEKSTEWLNDYLKYVSLENTGDSKLLSMGENDYCAENTNTAQNSTDLYHVLKYKNSPAITSILVKARVCTLDENEDIKTDTLVRYKGELFMGKTYLNYVINHLILSKGLNAYYVVDENAEESAKTYKHIDYQYVELKKLRDVQEYHYSKENIDGYYAVVPNSKFSTTTLYKKGDNGTFEKIDDKEVITLLFDEFNADADALGYVNGLMYYNIPIEHLNSEYTYDETNAGDDQPKVQLLNEGNVGIVRNHHYYVTITSLEHLGKGIVDEGEVIVPDPKDYLDTYYVGAEINVLPWKIVEQEVEI